MKPRSSGAARRYARALLELALDGGDPAALGQDLSAAADFLETQPEFQRILAHPAVPAERKTAMADAVFTGAPILFSRLLRLLVERERTQLLPDIGRAYAALWNAHRNVVAARAVTAAPLTPNQGDALTAALGRATGKTVELTGAVDVEILGGVLVEMEGRIFDGTVRGRLKGLRQRLVAGAEAVT